jgi:outer membrane protein OmpA-like peptidoglycan-associated protein/tetratricopeptide (TPR) repeat protein
MKKTLFILFLGVLTSNLFSQHKQYNQSITEGNYLFMEKNYHMALTSYEAAYQLDSMNANINYKIGLCYLNIPSKKKNAFRFLEKASKNISKGYDEDEPGMKSAPVDAIYYHAKAQHYSGNFNVAIDEFQKYQKIVGLKNKERNEDIERQVFMCKNAIELYKTPDDITIKNLGDSINSDYPDYGPVVNADESVMFFTSRRPGSTGGERGTDGQFYEDIYNSYKNADNSWSRASNLYSLINSNTNEATIGLSCDGHKLYLYKDEDIYYSSLIGDSWSGLTSFGEEVNSKHFEAHITISSDGKSMFFSSDRPGGFGGTDLYRCTKLDNGKWSAPVNLGPAINTKYNEDAPYIHPDGKKFFFSSEGHNTIGGFDIFYADLAIDAGGNLKWEGPFSLGVPVNTTDDDEFYIPTSDGSHAYFSSAREGGVGDQDIYIANMPSRIKVDPLLLLKGIVSFDGKEEHPSGLDVSVFDGETNALIMNTTPNYSSGKYMMLLNPGQAGKKYKVNYEASGYQPVSFVITVEPGSPYKVIEKDIVFESLNPAEGSGKVVAVSGTVKNQKGEFIPAVQISVKDNNTGVLLSSYTTNHDSGYYYFKVARGKNYNVSYEATGYLFQSQNVEIPKTNTTKSIQKNIVLEVLQTGAKMVLNNIFFDLNKATLRKQSLVEIATVQKMLLENPKIIIEISGHTDSKGNDAINQKLSEARANSVVAYLVKNGVPATQLRAKGYGKAQPVAPNLLPNGKPNLSGMQLNRRVEMKIVE